MHQKRDLGSERSRCQLRLWVCSCVGTRRCCSTTAGDREIRGSKPESLDRKGRRGMSHDHLTASGAHR